MATIFWDTRGYNSSIIFRRSKNDQWRLLCSLIEPFQQHLKKKTSLFGEEESVLPSRCACVHTCLAPMAKFNEFCYELLPHSAHSPISCDYFLFPNLKKWFGRKRFTIREQLIAKIEAYFEGLNKSYYSDGLKKPLENR